MGNQHKKSYLQSVLESSSQSPINEIDKRDALKRKEMVNVMKALENFMVEDDWPRPAGELQPLVDILDSVGVISHSIEAAMNTMDPDKQQQYLVLGYQGGYDWEGGKSQVGALKGLRNMFSR